MSSLIKKILNDELNEITNKEFTISGWVITARIQKNIGFISVNDGSCLNCLQIVIDEQNLKNISHIKNITKGITVKVTGIIIESPKENQKYEMKCNANNIKVFGKIESDKYPMSKGKHNLEFLRQHLHLRIKTNVISAVSRIRSTCSFSTHEFFKNKNFIYIQTPLITGNDCEGAGETFTVTNMLKDKINDIPNQNGKIDYSQDFFGKKSFLTVSGQLHAESFALGLNRVYTFGPTFRAENSNTSRHLAEFWMIEPELCFINLIELMDLAEEYIKYCIQKVLESNPDDIEFMNSRYSIENNNLLKNISTSKFKRITYTEAVDFLKKNYDPNLYPNLEWGDDLSSEQEKYITKIMGPTIVYNYPSKIKSFYMKKNEDNITVQAMDVLVPGIGELIGGSIREDNYDKLMESVTEKNIDTKSLDWYLQLREFGTTPHGGFGLGFERLIMLITGLTNIKDCISFPRSTGNCLL
jgi:asparaginyl-tRNA synthetase